MRDGSPALPQRWSRLLLVAMVLGGALAVLAPRAAGTARADSDGLAVSSSTTYVVDANAGTVRVSTDLTFTNTTRDTTSNGTVRRLYYTGFTYPAPLGTANQAARTDRGTPVPLEVRPADGSDRYVVFRLGFPSSLFSGETLRVNVTYDIVGLPPRSADPTRVNPAYFAFVAYGPGDAGKASIRVEVPAGLVVDTFGGDAVTTQEGGTTVITADAIPDPQTYTLFVTARNDGRLEYTSTLGPEGTMFGIYGWPGDADWKAFVQTQIDTGLPELTKLVGRPWPIDEQVAIREAVTPYLYGYAGWFSAVNDELEVGEDLDAETVLHELSHAWFNTNWFTDRWVNEGLAQVYSNAALMALGQTGTAPTEPVAADPAKISLADWGDPKLDTGADDTETYGYNASYWVVRQLTDEIGMDKMAEVFAAVDTKTIAYVGDAPAESVTGETDWRRFLDLTEQIGGSKGIESLMTTYVLDASDAALLPERATARDRYATLESAGAGWAVPVVIREDMADWKFDDATVGMQTAKRILDVRATLDQRGDALGIDLTSRLEQPYESATDLDALSDTANATLQAADLVVAADSGERAGPGVIQRIGLIGSDVSGDVDAARAALASGDRAGAMTAANHALSTLAAAEGLGWRRLLIALVGVAALLVLVAVLVLRARRPPQVKAPDVKPPEVKPPDFGPPELRPPTSDPSR